jgi:hypothetical protein
MAKVDLSTPALAVEQGARVLESVEADLPHLRSDVLKLDDVLEAGLGFNVGGQFPGLGRTLVGELRGEVASIAGALGDVQRRVYALHARLTKAAEKGGHDVPQPFGGGDR